MIVILFAICWSPTLIDNVLVAFELLDNEHHGFLRYMRQSFALLSYANSCVNPVVYAFMSKNFRAGFRKALGCGGRTSCLRAPPTGMAGGPTTATQSLRRGTPGTIGDSPPLHSVRRAGAPRNACRLHQVTMATATIGQPAQSDVIESTAFVSGPNIVQFKVSNPSPQPPCHDGATAVDGGINICSADSDPFLPPSSGEMISLNYTA